MNVRSDIDSYREYYEYFDNPSIKAKYNFEPGYMLLNGVFRFFHIPFDILMISIGVFYCAIFWKASKKYTEYPGLCLLPSLFFMFYYSTGALRQSIAQIISYYAFSFLLIEPQETNELRIERKPSIFSFFKNTDEYLYNSVSANNLIRYYVFSIVCFMFHRSAIILLFVPLLNKRRNRIIIAFVFAFFYAFQPFFDRLIVFIPYLNQKYQYYKIVNAYNVGAKADLGIRTFEYIISIVLLLFRKKRTGLENMALYLLEYGLLIQIFLTGYLGSTYRLLQFTDIGIILFSASTYYWILDKFRKNSIVKIHLPLMLYFIAIAFLVFFRFYRLFAANTYLGLHYSLIIF